jgi:hypothetical protein
LDDEDALSGVPLGVRMLRDVKQVAALDVEDDILEADATLLPELSFFASSQAKYFTSFRISRCVPKRHTLASGTSVPKSVPERSPTTVIRQPMPTTNPIKNGPEIVNFRPVL